MMAVDTLNCWRCGAAVVEEPLPLSRAAECRACRAELHVCRMCEFYAPGRANDCREPVAEPVSDKARANFCGWFRPRAGLAPAGNDAAEAARRQLEDLFR
jgi:hypothetical protein